MIRKVGSRWCLFTKDGKRKLGCHDTREEALAQERAVQSAKHANGADLDLRLSRDVVAKLCGSCAEEMDRKGISSISVKHLVGSSRFRAAVAEEHEPGFFSYCKEKPIGSGTDEFCAWLHHELLGFWPAEKTEKYSSQRNAGGKGSGHFGHAGRPGKIGGSSPGDRGAGDEKAPAAVTDKTINALAHVVYEQIDDPTLGEEEERVGYLVIGDDIYSFTGGGQKVVVGHASGSGSTKIIGDATTVPLAIKLALTSREGEQKGPSAEAKGASRDRTFRGAAGGANIRKELYDGREHFVVPIVALVEGVITASNASSAEFVPFAEIAKGVSAWNGRPLMFDHPKRGSQPVVANSPRVLDTSAVGTVFNARVKDRKLLMDAYIDPARVRKLGKDAEDVFRRAKAGEVVDVSVGVFVDAEPRAGSFGGKTYTSAWRNIVPDHLAILPTGVSGACSVSMGCGTRAASAKVRGGGSVVKGVKGKLVRLMNTLLRAAETDVLDVQELRDKLSTAVVTHFDKGGEGANLLPWVETFFPTEDGGEIVYQTDGKTFKAPYALSDDGEVSISFDAAVAVARKTSYEPTTSKVEKEEEEMNEKEKKELEERHAAEVARLQKEISELKAAAAVPKTDEEFLAIAPDSIKRDVQAHRAAAATRRAELMTAAKAQDAFSEEDLSAMPIEQLEKVVKLASSGRVDQSGRAVPRSADGEVPPVPDMAARIRAAREKK